MSTNDAPPNRGASPDTEPESQTKKRKQGKAHEGPVDYGPYLQLDNVERYFWPSSCQARSRQSSAKGLEGAGTCRYK